MTGIREYGTFVNTTELRAISELFLTLIPLDHVAHWGRCGMTADFLAHYLAFNFENTDVAQNVMSTVLNEMVENIVKFSHDKRTEVSVSMIHYGETICITTVNVTSAARADLLAASMEEITRGNLDDLFMERIERTVETKQSISGLGLLTIKRDYRVGLGVRIAPLPGRDRCEVFMQVSLDVEQLEQQDFVPRSSRTKSAGRFDPPSSRVPK